MASYRSFLAQYRLAYRHFGGVKALALGELEPQWFKDIQREMSWVIEGQPSSDVASPRHTTNWTRPIGIARQFSLYNPTGKTDEYLSDFAPPSAVPKKFVFPHLEATARFARLFGSELWNLRLNGLGEASGLSLHEESSIAPTRLGRTYKLRMHLPIFTNANARMLLDGEAFQFEEGVLYFFHHGCVHAALNPANTPRYHLVLDCLATPELYARLFPTGGSSRADPGFKRFSATEARDRCRGQTYAFGPFVTESGTTIDRLNYGRHVPTVFDWYRKNYPSAFRPIDRLLGESRGH